METCPLGGPASVTLTQISWRGLLARGATQMQLKPAGFSIVNAAQTLCAIEKIGLDPLRCDPGGTDANATLSLVADDSADRDLAPGGSLRLRFDGAVPTRPGTYTTTARILVTDGAALCVPITIAVPASPLGGIGCMLLGLALLGTVNLLAGEGAVRTHLRNAIKARRDIAAVLAQTPAPESRAADVLNMNHDFEAAIASLSARRAFSAQDDRDAEARPHLEAAKKRADSLRTDLAGRRPGMTEIENLQHDWANLLPVLKAAAAPAPEPMGSGLPATLDGFLARYHARLIGAPAISKISAMDIEFNRMTLEEIAGEGRAAADRALADRDQLRHFADGLNQAIDGYQAVVADTEWILNAGRALRTRLSQSDLPAELRQSLASLLDQADAQWDGAPWLENWRQAHHLIDQALTTLARADADAHKVKVNETIATVNQMTGWDDVDAAITQALAAPKPHTLAMKQGVLTHVVNLWRAHVANMDEVAAREKLEQLLDKMQASVSAGKLVDAATEYGLLTQGWAAWNGHLVQRELAKLQDPPCLGGVVIPLDAGGTSAHTCLKQPELIKPRGLTLGSGTPPDSRIVGRKIEFSLLGADPAWGAAVTMRVDFGDDTPAFLTTAESLRARPTISHIYTAPIETTLTVQAVKSPTPGAVSGTVLGAGTMPIEILPIPGAQILADEFVNMRFALALVIALTLSYWRFQTRTAVFGARPYDYVEAFALGFAADAATSNLPDLVKQFYGS